MRLEGGGFFEIYYLTGLDQYLNGLWEASKVGKVCEKFERVGFKIVRFKLDKRMTSWLLQLERETRSSL